MSDELWGIDRCFNLGATPLRFEIEMRAHKFDRLGPDGIPSAEIWFCIYSDSKLVPGHAVCHSHTDHWITGFTVVYYSVFPGSNNPDGLVGNPDYRLVPPGGILRGAIRDHVQHLVANDLTGEPKKTKLVRHLTMARAAGTEGFSIAKNWTDGFFDREP